MRDNFILQGIKSPDHKLPEDFALLFSEETLNKVGFTEYRAKLYTEKMEKVIKEAPTVG